VTPTTNFERSRMRRAGPALLCLCLAAVPNVCGGDAGVLRYPRIDQPAAFAPPAAAGARRAAGWARGPCTLALARCVPPPRLRVERRHAARPRMVHGEISSSSALPRRLQELAEWIGASKVALFHAMQNRV
jgi:hypothetical protein